MPKEIVKTGKITWFEVIFVGSDCSMKSAILYRHSTAAAAALQRAEGGGGGRRAGFFCLVPSFSLSEEPVGGVGPFRAKFLRGAVGFRWVGGRPREVPPSSKLPARSLDEKAGPSNRQSISGDSRKEKKVLDLSSWSRTRNLKKKKKIKNCFERMNERTKQAKWR